MKKSLNFWKYLLWSKELLHNKTIICLFTLYLYLLTIINFWNQECLQNFKEFVLDWLNSSCFFQILPKYWVLSKFVVLFLQGLLCGEGNQIQITVIFVIILFSNDDNIKSFDWKIISTIFIHKTILAWKKCPAK